MQERSLALKRTSRTLLVLADGTRTLEELLQFVRGSDLTDLEELRAAGLVTLSEAPSAGPRRAEATAGAGPAPRALVARTPEVRPSDAPEALKPAAAMSYQELYAALNLLCRDYLGLIKGFRYSMEIEKAADVHELKAVARRFAVEVEQTKGHDAGQLVRRALVIDD